MEQLVGGAVISPAWKFFAQTKEANICELPGQSWVWI
jgi:hypothetical protein